MPTRFRNLAKSHDLPARTRAVGLDLALQLTRLLTQRDNRAMHAITTTTSWRLGFLALSAVMASEVNSFAVACDEFDSRIVQALDSAKGNRREIELFLANYASSGDHEKADAARWLVANMDGHGFAVMTLVDKEGAPLAFDALDYTSLTEAKKALDAIEATHPQAEFKKTRFDSDLEHASAAFLSTHLDGAFEAWRSMPWSKSIRYEVFREFILPYRGSNEPLCAWRAPARERLAALCAELNSETDVLKFGEKTRAAVHGWVGFTDLFYLHPTDQSYDEMCRRKLGRCEDITNMISFGMRSVAALCASDYTPWWADRDNNHAWEVVLDQDGKGRAGLSNRCAKVYRKTFALRKNEEAPRWLASSHFVDVTAQYQATTTVTIDLATPPKDEQFAYLAVFNGGEWRPIQWGRIENGRVSFAAMGRDICYLPMIHRGGVDVPLAAPIVLDRDGNTYTLAAKCKHTTTLLASTTKPETPDADTGVQFPQTLVKPGAAYELFVWSDTGWKSCGRLEQNAGTREFTGLVDDGLYWLVEDGSEKLERIFTMESGRQVFW